MRILLYLTVFTILTSVPGIATSQIDLFPIEALQKEVLYDKTPVSGEIRVGIVSEMDDIPISPEYIYTTLPDIDLDGKMLCALVSSKNGLYRGILPYELNNQMKTATTARLKWDSEYDHDLTKYSQQDITVLCKIAESCSSTAELFTIASWSAKPTESFYILLNATHKPRILLDNADVAHCDCKKIDSDNNVTYNYICEIPKNVVNSATTFRINQKVTRLGRTTNQTYPLPLSTVLK